MVQWPQPLCGPMVDITGRRRAVHLDTTGGQVQPERAMGARPGKYLDSTATDRHLQLPSQWRAAPSRSELQQYSRKSHGPSTGALSPVLSRDGQESVICTCTTGVGSQGAEIWLERGPGTVEGLHMDRSLRTSTMYMYRTALQHYYYRCRGGWAGGQGRGRTRVDGLDNGLRLYHTGSPSTTARTRTRIENGKMDTPWAALRVLLASSLLQMPPSTYVYAQQCCSGLSDAVAQWPFVTGRAPQPIARQLFCPWPWNGMDPRRCPVAPSVTSSRPPRMGLVVFCCRQVATPSSSYARRHGVNPGTLASSMYYLSSMKRTHKVSRPDSPILCTRRPSAQASPGGCT